MTDYYAPTYRNAVRDAWHEFTQGVQHRYWDLSDPKDDDGEGWPKPLAWLCAPWRPFVWRFKDGNLERLFRPRKAQRRRDAWHYQERIFVCGGEDMSAAEWSEAEALAAEFGVELPPRDWKAMSAAETVGMGMGYTREEVAEIVGRAPIPF